MYVRVVADIYRRMSEVYVDVIRVLKIRWAYGSNESVEDYVSVYVKGKSPVRD